MNLQKIGHLVYIRKNKSFIGVDVTMVKQTFFISFLVSLSFFIVSPAFAKRIALIIGNDNYSNLPPQYQLQKAKNDAQSTAETFKALGFQVIEGFDLKRREMNVKLSSFANSIDPGDEVMFFFLEKSEG